MFRILPQLKLCNLLHTLVPEHTYNIVPVNIRKCETFVTFKHRLKARILSNNGGPITILFAVLLLFFFPIIEFQVWFMSIANFSTTYAQIFTLVLNLSGVSFYSNHPIFNFII